MSKPTRKLDKFVQRFNKGDFGYCCHRLRKFARRRQDAAEAIKFVVQSHESVLKDLDEYPRLVTEVLDLAGDAVRDEVDYLEFAKLALDSGFNDLWERAVANAPEERMLDLVKRGAERTNGAGCSAVRRYLIAERKQGLLNAIKKAYELADEILPRTQGLCHQDLAELKMVNLFLDQFRIEALDDFAGLFQGSAPTAVAIADDCEFTNEFGDFGFASANEFVKWASELADDRGPLSVEAVNPTEHLKMAGYNLPNLGWLDTRAAVVRTTDENESTLFLVVLGSDFADGKVHKVWLSTDNRLWDFDFEAPKYPDDMVTITREFTVDAKAAAEAGEQCRQGSIRPDYSNRPTRANELAKKIHEWTIAPSDKCFRQSVWAVGVDAIAGNTVFVPSELAEDGTVKAIGPVGPDGQRIYLCYVDCPRNGKMHTEMKLSAFLRVVLGDDKTIGVAFKTTCGEKLLVRRDTLEELAGKVGPGLTGKDAGDAGERCRDGSDTQPSVLLPTRFKLEKAIEEWDRNPNPDTYTKALWALGMDAALGRQVYLQDDPKEHLLPDAQHRLFAAHLDVNTLKSPNELGFKVVGLMELPQSILSNDEPEELEVVLAGRKNFPVPEVAIDRLMRRITNALNTGGKDDDDATKD